MNVLIRRVAFLSIILNINVNCCEKCSLKIATSEKKKNTLDVTIVDDDNIRIGDENLKLLNDEKAVYLVGKGEKGYARFL